MSTPDPIEEHQRLRELYQQMTDEELEAVANGAYQLTDVANSVLQSEIRSRGLNIGLTNAPADEDLEPYFDDDELGSDPTELDLVALSRVWDLEEARQIKTVLLDAGIPCFLGPDHVAKLESFRSVFEPGMDLKVRSVDRQAAVAVLSEFGPKDGPAPELETNTIACCPRCKSPDITFESLEPDGSASADPKFAWKCDTCGHQWTDDGIEQEVPLQDSNSDNQS